MITIDEALKLIQTQPVSVSKTTVPVDQSVGYWLAEDIVSPLELPPFDNSAMDGYALCRLHSEYQIIGEVAAGDTSSKQLTDGKAMRIFTGGKVPENTTAVVMQEKTEVNGDSLKIVGELKENQNIRRKGGELSLNQDVFSTGKYINPATAGLIGSLGKDTVSVGLKPTISLISTGNELVTPGTTLQEGQIYESNSIAIDSALQRYGFACTEKEHVLDDYESTKQAISKHLESVDVLLLSGGISVGDYDFVKKALEENGVEQVFYKVAQKPGKPLYFGKKGHQYVFALPGNPASSLTCFHIYVLPLLQRMSGANETGLQRVASKLAQGFELKGDRPAFLKAKLDYSEVTILDGQGSSMIHSLANANALAFLESGAYKKGDVIKCIVL